MKKDKVKEENEKKIKTENRKEEKINAQSAQLPPLKPKVQNLTENNIELLLDVPLQLTAELGRCSMTIKNVLELAPGSVIELNKLAGEPAELMVNGKLIAKGEIVIVDENFGIRITEIVGPEARVRELR